MCGNSTCLIRCRLAPSPTGNLHLGNAFAFLAAWLNARSQHGAVILRIEDIDPERSRQNFVTSIMDDLQWLGITWDEGPDMPGPYGPYIQSARYDTYNAALELLEQNSLVYPCFCTRKELRSLASAPHRGDEGVAYPGTCRNLNADTAVEYAATGKRFALRLDTDAALHKVIGMTSKMEAEPGDSLLQFNDGVLGEQNITLAQSGGDFALRRSDGVVAYQLAVTIDDAAMAISEVVRGEDLLLSTPRQILLHRLLGKKPPEYAHIPLMHTATGERLAKRHNSLEICALRNAGISPQSITGYLGYLAGWQSKLKAAAPLSLLEGFSLQSLKGRYLQLPEDVTMILKSI